MKIPFCFLFALSFIISVDCSSYAQSSLNLNLDSSSKNCVAVIRKNGKLGIVNALGEWIAQPVYSQLGNISTQEQYMNLEWKSGMVVVKRDRKYGVLNCYGKEVIPCVYNNWPSIENGIIYVQDNQGVWSMFDKEGKQLKKLNADYPGEYWNGVRQVSLNKKDTYENDLTTSYVLVNRNGDSLLKMKNSRYVFKIIGTSEGMTAFIMYPIIYGGLGMKYGSIGFLDELGNIAVPPIYSAEYIHGRGDMSSWEYKPAFHSGRALVFLGKMPLYIDKKGNEVITFDLFPGQVRVFNDFNKYGYTLMSYSKVVDGRSVGYSQIIDTNGRMVLTTNGIFGVEGLQYENISDFEYFTIVEREQRVMYNAKMERLSALPYKDENYKYTYFSNMESEAICVLRRHLQHNSWEVAYLNRNGETLVDYSSLADYFDPFTKTTIRRNDGTKGIVMLNELGETVYACDSCGFGDLSSLVNNHHYSGTVGGVFEIGKGNEIILVNHQGTVLTAYDRPENRGLYFRNIAEEFAKYRNFGTEPDIRINVTKKQLDTYYELAPWNPVNK